MPKLAADDIDLWGAQDFLARHSLAHLRVRKHADLLVLESGSAHDPFPRARLRRVTKQYWSLEMPTHSGRWQKTPFRGPRNDVLTTLIESLPWMIQPLDQP
jgi:hypothetical protein